MTDMRHVFDVRRQIQSKRVRAACLATLRAGDVVQAVDMETGALVGTRLLDAVDRRRESGGGTREDWPQRYLAGDWRADDEGCELDAGQERIAMGWVLVRPPLTPHAAAPLLQTHPARPPPFSWDLHERHMRATHAAVLDGTNMPEAPWA